MSTYILNAFGAIIFESTSESLKQAVEEAVRCKVSLKWADLSHADLCYANLIDADLRNANLCYANLSDAELSGVNLIDGNLSHADLCYADLIGAELSHANLFGADLRNANLRGAKLTCASTSAPATPTIMMSKDGRREAILSLLIEDEQLRQRLNIKAGIEFSQNFDIERLLKVAVSRRVELDPGLHADVEAGITFHLEANKLIEHAAPEL